MKFLFFFLDGVGLGEDDPQTNPFSSAHMPALQSLLGGERLLIKALESSFARAQERGTGSSDSASKSASLHGRARPLVTEQATLLPLDANLGTAGLPQSATGQATLLTGINVPAVLGHHYGPKPDRAVTTILREDNLFHRFNRLQRQAALLNAYPPSYFASVTSGRRLFSSIPLAVTSAGLSLRTGEDLAAGRALSADFTGRGWREHLGLPDTPIISPQQAGERMARLAQELDFAFFEFWLSDYAGHNQDMPAALSLLQAVDQALSGLLSAWDHEQGLILLTSDHGNLEDLSTRRHTYNPVPALLIGPPGLRHEFTRELIDLTGIAPAILKFYS